MDSSIVTYILAFAAVTMAAVFGFRSWMLSKRERSSRHLRRSGSRQSRGFSRRFLIRDFSVFENPRFVEKKSTKIRDLNDGFFHSFFMCVVTVV
jgi:hypothetical protein